MISYSQLKDFDWSVRFTLSSDHLTGLRKPILLLKFDTIDASGELKDSVVELDAEEALDFLTSLKKCRAMIRKIQ